MRKYFFLLLLFVNLVSPVSADGMAFKGNENRWALQPENMQLAAINYENGYENLLLSVTLEKNLPGNKTVWIFPVPAQPDSITIDVVKGYPQFGGKNLNRMAGDAVGTAALSAAAYGTFPASLPVWVWGNAGFFSVQKSQEAGIDPSGLVIHERIEKMGMVTELVTARDGASVRDYLSHKGIMLPQDAVAALDDYIGEEYSFVISYAGNAAGSGSGDELDAAGGGTNDADILAVFVRFPTDRIYFPLRPTSIYGSRIIPVVIDVTGFVTPRPDEKIRSMTDVSYFVDEWYWNYYSADNLGRFFNYPAASGPVKYTRIRITAPSESFTSDLFIDTDVPLEVQVKEALIRNTILWAIPLFIIISMLASLAAGSVVFGHDPAYRKDLALHGLWNCATMIGFACGTAEYLKIRGATWEQRARFFILFYILFVGTLALIAAVARPTVTYGLVSLFTFLFILPVIGFMFGIHIFPENPVLALILFTLNASVYGIGWLLLTKYKK